MGDRLNTQLSENEEMLLASMIGGRFDEYRCDPFFVTKAVYGVLGLLIDGEAYELANFSQVEDHYFGYREEAYGLGPVDQDLDDDDTDEYDETVERRVFSLASGAWIA